jgi:CDP-glucose 4,6-dehydratase
MGGMDMNEIWKDRNVFITGANGLVGSWLTKELVKRGANAVVLIRDFIPKYNLLNDVYNDLGAVVNGSITDLPLVERILNEYEIDCCFHLAAQTIVGIANRSPLSTFESNIKGTWNILEAARTSKLIKRVIVASSDKAYGEQKTLPYTEDMCLMANHPYDASKACTDILARSYFNAYGLPVAVTRCANIYGGGDLNFSRIIPDTIRSILHGTPPVIRSDGSPVREYMYVKDAVAAYLTLAKLIDKKDVAGEAFNFGAGNPITVLELVMEILRVSGRTDLKPVIVGKGKTKGEIEKQFLSIEKARRVLKWHPKYDLAAGLKETIQWYDAFFKSR